MEIFGHNFGGYMILYHRHLKYWGGYIPGIAGAVDAYENGNNICCLVWTGLKMSLDMR